MTFSDFTSKLNWRLMIVHILACWFFFQAFQLFGFLYDYKYLEQIRLHNYKGLDGRRIAMIPYRAALIGLGAFLCGFAISVTLSFKYKWSWVNSIIVFLGAFLLLFLDRFYFAYIKPVLHFPGRFFKSDWAYILTNGSFMLAVGLLLFFLKGIVKFIEGKKLAQVKE